jgi:hypothetical protein
MGTRGSFPGSKAAGAWNRPLTSSSCRGQENVNLYIHSPIRLHGVVFNYLSTETTLPFTLACYMHRLSHPLWLALVLFDKGYKLWSYFLGFLSPYVFPNIPPKLEEPIDAFECMIFLFRNRVVVSSFPGQKTRYSERGFTWSLQVSADTSNLAKTTFFKVFFTERVGVALDLYSGGTRCQSRRWNPLSWLRSSAISDDVTGFFNWPNPSSRTMTLGSTQPGTEMSSRILPGG